MTAASTVETVVIGAGVVGLAIARALAMSGRDVLILDRASHIGSETSSRNSEVIHAGLYYPKDSLKARFCVQGRHLMYKFCRERSIDVNQCGKLIVATDTSQQLTIQQLQQQARDNGVCDTTILSQQQVKELEPQVESHGALFSPSTGIVDSHNFMVALLADAEEHGATLALRTKVSEAKMEQGMVHLFADDTWLACKSVINSAGLWADRVAAMIHQKHWWCPPRQYYAKGTYFRVAAKVPFTHLIYPVPDLRGGLGVHATMDSSGQTKFGPDVEWLEVGADPDEIELNPDPQRAQSFYESIRKYWPGLPDEALLPDYVGVRPKLAHPLLSSPVPFQDFAILGTETHGISGLVHLMGIESPGLTSSMAIADHVVRILDN